MRIESNKNNVKYNVDITYFKIQIIRDDGR